MSFSIRTNLAGLLATYQLSQTQRRLGRTVERLSSGRRIARAADDPSGLAMAERFDAEARSAQQAARNADDAISALQVADQAASEIGELLKQTRELAVLAASSTVTAAERSDIHNIEWLDISNEINRIANSTEYSGIGLTSGPTVFNIDIQVGTGNTNSRINLRLNPLRTTDIGAVWNTDVNLSTTATASAALTKIDAAIEKVNSARARYASGSNRLDSALRNLESYEANMISAESNIRDADVAFESANLVKLQMMQDVGIATIAQSNRSFSSLLALLS